MSDMTLRKLEREAAMGDEHAQERLQRARQRAGNGRHGDKLGKWVCVDGVRDHYRGRLLYVTEHGAGRATLHLAPLYWQPSLAEASEEYPVRCSEEHPADLSADVVGLVSLQPEGWPTA